MRCLVVNNEKGGVGKTTLAFHASHKLAEKHRVLVIDLDQQQSALTEPMRAFASSIDAISVFAEPTAIRGCKPKTPKIPAGVSRHGDYCIAKEIGMQLLAFRIWVEIRKVGDTQPKPDAPFRPT